MVQAVGFDLDGTLFDDKQYTRAGLDAAADLLERRIGRDLRDELHTAYFERGIHECTFDVVLKEEGLSDDLVDDLVEAYHANDAQLTPFSEAEKVLRQLRDQYRLGLLTGGRNGRVKLERLALDNYFDTIIVTPQMGTTKRHREPFEVLLERLNVDASETVYVGDRPELDFVHPNRLGIHTVQFLSMSRAERPKNNEAKPDCTIETLADLPEVLEEL